MNLVVVSPHVRRFCTLSATRSISGGSKLNLAALGSQVQIKHRIGTIAKAAQTSAGRVKKREKNWEKIPSDRIWDYAVSRVPKESKKPEAIANLVLKILALFWFTGLPWFISLVPFFPLDYTEVQCVLTATAWIFFEYNSYWAGVRLEKREEESEMWEKKMKRRNWWN